MSRAPTSDARGSAGGCAAEPDVRDRHELPVAPGRDRRQQQRHAIDDERLHDAVDEPLAQAEQIEVAVQIAREADERAAVVVAIAVVHAVEAGLDRVLHRAATSSTTTSVASSAMTELCFSLPPPRNTSLASFRSTA